MNNDAHGTFKLLPDESGLIRTTLMKEWTKQQLCMEILTEELHREYSCRLQRGSLDSYPSFKRCLVGSRRLAHCTLI